MAVEIRRKELSASELRREAAWVRDAKAARRMLALALVLEGRSRTEAAGTCGMDRQTLRDWVHRDNEEGLPGLSDRPLPGRTPMLGAEQMRELAAIVEAGPDPETDGVVAGGGSTSATSPSDASGGGWRSGPWVRSSAGSASRGCRRDRATRGATCTPRSYIKNFAELARTALPDEAKDKPLEIWFQDEARVGQQGTLARLWARRGSRRRAPKDGRYAWAYIFGAVCPARATGAALVMPYANTGAMNAHLAEIALHVTPGAHAILVLDGAGWHGSSDLVVPENITLLTLPPYSPELNPVENVWQFLRQNRLANRVFDGDDAIVEACCDAWNALLAIPERVTSITSRDWATVSQ